MSNNRYRFRFFLILLIGFLTPVDSWAQASDSVIEDPAVQAIIKDGLDDLYNLRFREAEVSFTEIDRQFPKHPIGPFLLSLTTWWEILLDLSDTSHDKAFFNAMDEVIDRSDQILKRDKENLDAMFFKGAALGFRGRLRSNRGDWFKSAMDGKKAMNYVLAVADQNSDNNDYVFGRGIYDYFADVVPEKYPFVKPVMAFFPEGDRARGMALLERTATHGNLIQAEAAYFLLQINYIFENDYSESVRWVEWLRRKYPDNSFFHAIEGRVHANFGRWHMVAPIFDDILQRYLAGQPGYNDSVAEQALYYLGRRQMVMRDYDEALDYFLKLEALASRLNEDTYFKVYGRLRQGMAYDAKGDRALAVSRYKEVLDMKDWAGVHERAQRYIDRRYPG